MFLETVSDLANLRIALVRDSFQIKRLRETAADQDWTPTIVETDSLHEAFRMVHDGRADATIANRFFADRNEKDFGLTPSQLILWPTPLFFAYNKDVDPTLADGVDIVLSLMKAQPGSPYFEAHRSWFSESMTPAYNEWLLWGAAIVLLVAATVLAANAYLRRRIAGATLALRESESRFKDFAECGSDFFWEMDKDLKFSYFSERFEEISGFSREQMLGRTRDKADIPNPDQAALNNHMENFRNRRPVRGFLYPQQKPDGTKIFLSINGIPHFSETGEFRGYRGTGTDITMQIQAEMAHEAALKEAELSSRAKSAFLATMSHEFRTPLNAIIGFSEMLLRLPEKTMTRERMLDYADSICGSGTHMLSLVNDVLDISTIEAGKLTLNKETMDLGNVVDVCMNEVRGSADAKRVTLKSDLDEALPLLHADEKKVRQILSNLLSNSLKFTNAEGEVQVSARASGNVVSIAVTDNGSGIPPEKLDTITQPFVKASANPFRAEDGTGLGLAIVKSLVEAHGGTLSIENVAQGGARVAFDLPRDTRMIN